MSDGKRGLKKEKRLFERFNVNFPAKFLDLACGREAESKACDLSVQGLGLVASEKVAKDTPLKIWLHFPDDKEPLCTEGEVAWCKQKPEGDWNIGVYLEKPQIMGFSRLFRLQQE